MHLLGADLQAIGDKGGGDLPFVLLDVDHFSACTISIIESLDKHITYERNSPKNLWTTEDN